MTATAQPVAPEVGTPATIVYYTDTRAAVVTKATAKRVWVARVETKPETRRTENEDEVAVGANPVRVEDGDVTQPLGEGEQYTLYVNRNGTTYATKGDKSITVWFGRSVTRVDYRY